MLGSSQTTVEIVLKDHEEYERKSLLGQGLFLFLDLGGRGFLFRIELEVEMNWLHFVNEFEWKVVNSMARKKWGLALGLLALVPVAALAKRILERDKGSTEQGYAFEDKWEHQGLEVESVADSKTVAGVIQRSLELEIDGDWAGYEGGFDWIEWRVNGGEKFLLEPQPGGSIQRFTGDMEVSFTQGAIERIAKLTEEDHVMLYIANQAGRKVEVKVPNWVLRKWIFIFNRAL